MVTLFSTFPLFPFQFFFLLSQHFNHLFHLPLIGGGFCLGYQWRWRLQWRLAMVIVVVGVMLQISYQLQMWSNNTIKVGSNLTLTNWFCDVELDLNFTSIIWCHIHSKSILVKFVKPTAPLTIKLTSGPKLEMCNPWHERVCWKSRINKRYDQIIYN